MLYVDREGLKMHPNIRIPKLMTTLTILILAALSCNLPNNTPTQIVVTAPPPITEANTAETVPPTVEAPTSTPEIVHTSTPDDVQLSGAIVYDVESQSTASEQRAPYGDSYDLNRLERPFTQDMQYLQDVDILHFRIVQKGDWYYVFIELIGSNPNNADPSIDYGVELDLDRDGNGDYLIWASPPYTDSWSNNNLKIFEDSNHDTGGPSVDKSDAPYGGNGYETLYFDRGLGDDPDLAWVRLDPVRSNVLQFAFKPSLLGSFKTFMWGVWADAGLKDVTKFNYNDHFTEEEAGSPIRGRQFYPLNQLYAVDNTCREAYNFNPTGYEPQICPRETPPTKEPGGPPPPGPTVCVQPRTCTGASYRWNQDTCTCEFIGPF
jgi:hypothetical protein